MDADLEVMARDGDNQWGIAPYLFTDAKNNENCTQVVSFIVRQGGLAV